VPFSVAAATLGRTPDTLARWLEDGTVRVPVVELPGNWRATFASWLAAVMHSPRPGRAGSLAAVTEAWWAEHDAADPTRKAVA